MAVKSVFLLFYEGDVSCILLSLVTVGPPPVRNYTVEYLNDRLGLNDCVHDSCCNVTVSTSTNISTNATHKAVDEYFRS